MDELYRARLSSTPHPHPLKQDEAPPTQDPNVIHIQPIPKPPPQPQSHQSLQPQPIPIHLPNIYVNPYPPVAPAPAGPASPSTRDANVPTSPPPMPKTSTSRLGQWRLGRAHPLLWVSLVLSFIALVLEVPKGSLPTLTGRHKTLRAKERLLNERVALLNQLSTFLPPPLSQLVSTEPSSPSGAPALQDKRYLDLLRPGALRFWTTNLGGMPALGVAAAFGAVADADRWWSIEELAEGVSLVRSKGDRKEREVWVVHAGKEDGGYKDSTQPLLSALTHSLLQRDRLLAELAALRAESCECTPLPPSTHVATPTLGHGAHGHNVLGFSDNEDARRRREEEWDALEDRKRREREREKEVEQREREAGRREKWVVEEMRKLSDKVHSQATELTLEDWITERLKAYQRQLASLGHENEA